MIAMLNHCRNVVLTPAFLMKYLPSPGNDNKVWIGDVVDPSPPDGSLPRTVSMTWGEECDIQVRRVSQDVFVRGRHCGAVAREGPLRFVCCLCSFNAFVGFRS